MIKTKQVVVIGLGAVLFLSAILGAISFSSPQPTLTREELNIELNAVVDSCLGTLPAGVPECDEQLQDLVNQLCQQVSSLDACSDGRVDEYYRIRGINR